MNRRHWLRNAALLTAFGWGSVRAEETADGAADLQRRWQSFLPPQHDLSLDLTPLQRSKDEWQKLLPGDSYAVLFEEATEPPFTSGFNHEKRPGLFLCRACRLPLFSSIPGHLAQRRDFKIFIPRTEYHCVRCGGHQGHVFDDGPAPTRQRWCNNGVALSFLPQTA